jgi:hypothetical protein
VPAIKPGTPPNFPMLAPAAAEPALAAIPLNKALPPKNPRTEARKCG